MKERDSYYHDFFSYKIKEETDDSRKKQEYWNTAIGLNQVDHLKPSEYLVKVASDHIEGNIISARAEELIKSYYRTKDMKSPEVRDSYECDLVSKRIVDLLDQGSFTFSPQMLKSIHKYLFQDILDPKIVGRFRDYNITKEEEILNGNTVNYANYFMIDDLFEYDFQIEKKYSYSLPLTDRQILNLSQFTSKIWQVHPFGEGNTRTTAVFMELYLNSIGFEVNNDMFKEYSRYFRGALVRSNYADVKYKVSETYEYLNCFFENLLKRGNYELRERELYCSPLFEKKEDKQ